MRMISAARRRYLAPEVIQTSAMDCGPAALKCLLEGFGIPISYGRLREACQTSVDGTSIDTLESLARSVGLDAEQVMMPVDHLLLAESEALPAIVVVRLPAGLMHFVVVWRVHGGWVQVMDPGRGRRWIRREVFLRDVYVHTMKIPAAAFREWAGSDAFLGPLGRRLRALGIASGPGAGGAQALVEAAQADPGWRRLASLDAAVRMVTALAAGGAVARGAEAARLVEALLPETEGAGAGPDEAAAKIVAAHASATPVAATVTATAAATEADAAAEEEVSMRGAVLVRIASATRLSDAARAELPLELRAAVDEPRARPAAALLALLREDGLLRWGALLAALVLAAGGAVLEAVLFRALFDVAGGHGAGILARLPSLARPAAAVAAALGFVAFLLLLELPVAAGLRGAGTRLENRLRRAFLRKIPRLGDRYFQSRPVSDMAERAHIVHRLRALPPLGGQLVRAACELVATAAALSWLYPRGARIALPLAGALLLVPLLAQPALTERDMRMRNHAGALARFYLDALLGLSAIRTHRAEEAMAHEHGARLREWVAAARAGLRAALAAETLQAIVGFGLAAWLLVDFVRHGNVVAGGSGAVLLVVFWSLSLPALGQEIAFLVQQYPAQRNVTLRLVEPLTTPEAEETGEPDPASPARNDPSGVGVRIAEAVVQAAGHVILTVDALAIEPGEHVAIVGPSGAGKSSLVGLLLGWHQPASGTLAVDGAPLAPRALEALRARTVWVDPTVYLWNRPLHANVAYGLAAAPPSLEAAIAEADLTETARRLPLGNATPLGEAGALVSGGEGQRVRFARGIVREAPRLVVLDEPFRGLSRDQRHTLMERARRRWAGVTLLCVTHDIEETRAFPRVLVVAEGRIVEDGSPEALLATPRSRYGALLDAETRVRAAAWSSAGTTAWRRLRLEGGQLVGRT
jgi:ATP-binding cassette subfamily B protein